MYRRISDHHVGTSSIENQRRKNCNSGCVPLQCTSRFIRRIQTWAAGQTQTSMRHKLWIRLRMQRVDVSCLSHLMLWRSQARCRWVQRRKLKEPAAIEALDLSCTRSLNLVSPSWVQCTWYCSKDHVLCSELWVTTLYVTRHCELRSGGGLDLGAHPLLYQAAGCVLQPA